MQLEDEIFKFSPSEIVCNEAFYMSGADLDGLKGRLVFTHSALENWYFDEDTCKKLLIEHFHTETAEKLGLQEYQVGLISSGALMQYLYQTQKNEMPHITALKPYRNGGFMILDTSTRRNLELTETLREKQKRGSLLWVLDQTKTAMG